MPETETDIEKRNKYGMLCGIVGIFLNLILFAGKLFAGMFSGAISITADAFNNLSDAGSSIITIAGFKMAAQRADEEHPYGHARMEYVATLAVAAIILIMGFELFRDSFSKIIKPQDIEFSWLIVAILLFGTHSVWNWLCICVIVYILFRDIISQGCDRSAAWSKAGAGVCR